MREVSKDEFYRRMNPLDVHPLIIGRYPYTALWRPGRSEQVVGKTVSEYANGVNGLTRLRYFLPETEGQANA